MATSKRVDRPVLGHCNPPWPPEGCGEEIESLWRSLVTQMREAGVVRSALEVLGAGLIAFMIWLVVVFVCAVGPR